MAQLTWLVTGCSSGFGEELIHAILARGDKAIATTRGPVSRISNLKDAGASTYSLDVTASQGELNSVMSLVIQENGTVDVLINNAGYVECGFVEEASYEKYFAQFETNVFGALKTTQAVLPHFRQKRSGTIVFIGSMYGLVGVAGASPYAGSKFALEGIHESLQQSVADLNIKSIIFEPGFFRTNVLHPEHIDLRSNAISDYDAIRAEVEKLTDDMHGNQPGDPKKAIEVILDVVKGEGVAAGKAMPERLPLGPDALSAVRKKCVDTLAICNEWEDVIRSTNIE